MSVNIRVNGINYKFVKQINVSKSLDEFSGHATLVVSEPKDDLSIILMNDYVSVSLDGHDVLSGFQEKMTDTEDNDTHNISFEIRDSVQDLIDSTIPISLRNPANYTDFIQILTKAISGLKLDFGIINQRGPLPITAFDSTGNSVVRAGELGQKTGDYLDECARLVSVIMNSDGSGNVLLRNFTNENKLKTMLLNKINGRNNNILNSSLSIDFSDRFGTVQVYSHGNIVFGDDGVASGMDDFKGSATDDEARPERVLQMISKTPLLSNKLCATRAQEEINLRRSRGFSYNCQVQGFSANGQLWDIGQLVRVDDEHRRVKGWLLIKEIEYELSDNGELTKMVLTYPDAYGVTLVSDASNLNDPNSVSMGVSYMKLPTSQHWKKITTAKLDSSKQAKDY